MDWLSTMDTVWHWAPSFIKVPQPWDCLREAGCLTALCLSPERENGQVPFPYVFSVSVTTRPRLPLGLDFSPTS